MDENHDTPMEEESGTNRGEQPERKASVQETKCALSRKLSNRMNTRELYERGIVKVPAEMTMSPQLQVKRAELERAKTVDALKRKISSRPDKHDLILGNILKDTAAHASLQNKQMQLKRRQIEDDLNERMFNRPGPLELVEKHILQDSELIDAIRSGQVVYRKTSDTIQRRRSSILNPLEQMAMDASELAELTGEAVAAPAVEEEEQLSSDEEGMDDESVDRQVEQRGNDHSPAVRRKGVVQPPVDLSLLTSEYSEADLNAGSGSDAAVGEQTRLCLQQTDVPVVSVSQSDPSLLIDLVNNKMSGNTSAGFHLSCLQLSDQASAGLIDDRSPGLIDDRSPGLIDDRSPGLIDDRSPGLTDLASPGLSDVPSPAQTNLMSPGLSELVARPVEELSSLAHLVVKSNVDDVRSPGMSVSSQDFSKPSTPAPPEVSDMVSQEPVVPAVREEAARKKESYRGGKSGASPRQLKRRKPKKPTQWKIHFYNPPNQSSASFSQQKPAAPVSNSPYQILIQQQQIYLQLQLMCQQMQQAAAAAAANSNVVNSSGNTSRFGREKVPSNLINHSNDAIPVTCSSGFASVPMPPPVPPLRTVQIPMAPGGHLRIPSTAILVTTANNTQPVVTQLSHTDPGKILETFTMTMLKEELKKRGLPVSGNKNQLINRLRPYADVVALAPGMRGKTQPVQPMALDLSVGSTVLSQPWRERSASMSAACHRPSMSSQTSDGYSVTSPLEEMRQLEQAVSGWGGQTTHVNKPQQARRGSGPASLEMYAQMEKQVHSQQMSNQPVLTGSQPLSHLPLSDEQPTVTSGLYMSGSASSSMEGIANEALPAVGTQDCKDSRLGVNSPTQQRHPGPLILIPNGMVTRQPNSPSSPLQSPKPLRRYVVEVEGLKRELSRHSQLIESPYGTPPSSNMFEVDSNHSSGANSLQNSPLSVSPVGHPVVFPGVIGSVPVGIPMARNQVEGMVYMSPNQGSPVGSNSVMISEAAMGSSPSDGLGYMGFGDFAHGDQQYFAGMSSRENSPSGGYFSQMLGLESGSPYSSPHSHFSGPSLSSGRGRVASLSTPRRIHFQLQGGQTPGQQQSPLMDSSSEPNFLDLDPNLVLGGNFLSSGPNSGTRTGIEWLNPASPVGGYVLPPFGGVDSGLGSRSGGLQGGSNPLLQDSFQTGAIRTDSLGRAAGSTMFEFDAGDTDLQYHQQPEQQKVQHLPPDYFQSTAGQLPLGSLGWNSWQG